jgi:hypothetical protein
MINEGFPADGFQQPPDIRRTEGPPPHTKLPADAGQKTTGNSNTAKARQRAGEAAEHPI